MALPRPANNFDFNKDTRHILMKIEIYLDGAQNPPLVIDLDNYLISADILEEIGSDDDWPLGLVSANELSLQLYNQDGIFNPLNPASPYYGKIRGRVMIKPFFKPATEEVEEWIPMGVFYVVDWSATITGVAANVLARDIMQTVFKEKPVELPIVSGKTYKEFYTNFFTALDIPVVVSDYFDKELPWAYTQKNNSQTIKELASSDLTICSSNRLGIIEVKHINESIGTVDTITDLNQIKDATPEQTISKAYGGSSLTYNIPQLAQNERIAEISTLTTPPGTYTHAKIKFTQESIYVITSVQFISEHNVKVISYEASSEIISVELHNPEDFKVEGRLVVYGMYLDKASIIMGTEDEENTLSISNTYIQTLEQAEYYKGILDKVVKSNMPDLPLDIRGNPLIQLGDQVKIKSGIHNLEFVGRLRRATYRFDGALSGTMNIINSSILED